MANAGAIRAGGAFVELFTEDSKVTQGLRVAEAKLKAFGGAVSGIGTKLAVVGGAITAPLLGAAHVYTDTASSLGRMSLRTGIAVEELSALSYVATRSGLDIEGLEMGIKKMQKTLFEGGEGSAEAKKHLQALGVSLQELKSMKPDEQMMRLADAFKATTDPTQKAGLAIAVFGRQGTEMIPFLERGSAGIKELKDEAARLGIVLGKDDVRVAKEFKGAMAQLKASAMAVTFAIGQAVIPAMTRMRERIMPIVTQIVAWIRANKGLFDTLFDVGTGITVAGVAMIGLGKVIGLVGGALVPIWKTLGFVIGAVLSPIGLVTAAVLSLGAAFLYLTETGAQVRAAFAGLFAELGATFSETWTGIVNALKANDMKLAFSIGLAGMKVAWLEFKIFLTDIWQQALAAMKTAWNKFWVDLRRIQSHWSGEIAEWLVALGVATGLTTPGRGADLVEEIQSQTRSEQRALNEVPVQVGVSPADRAALDAQRAELAKTQADLDALSGKAALAAAAKLKGAGMISEPTLRMPQLGLGGTGAGTFSAAGARAMGGGNNLAKIVRDGQDRAEKLLADIRQAIREGGMRFA